MLLGQFREKVHPFLTLAQPDEDVSVQGQPFCLGVHF